MNIIKDLVNCVDDNPHGFWIITFMIYYCFSNVFYELLPYNIASSIIVGIVLSLLSFYGISKEYISKTRSKENVLDKFRFPEHHLDRNKYACIAVGFIDEIYSTTYSRNTTTNEKVKKMLRV